MDPPQVVAVRYQTALNQQALTEKELVRARFDVKSARLELAALQDRKNSGARVGAMDPALLQHPGYQKMLGLKVQMEDEVSRIKVLAAPGAAARLLQDRLDQIQALDRELAAMEMSLRGSLETQEKARLETRLRVLEEQAQDLAAEYERQQQLVQTLAQAVRQPEQSTAELEALREEVAQSEQTLRKVAEQRDLLRMEPVLPARVSVLEAATVPLLPDQRKALKSSGMAGLVAFGLMALALCTQEYRARRVYGEEDIPRNGGVRFLGTFPKLAAAVWARKTARYEQAVLRVSVDAIRRRLLPDSEAGGRALVMSGVSEEADGARLARHLAASLAHDCWKVLLIQGEQIGSAATPPAHRAEGLGRKTHSDLIVPDAVPSSDVPGVWVLPGGKQGADALHHLSGAEGPAILEQLRRLFDLVLIVTGPVDRTGEALVLGQQTDGMVLTLRQGVSPVRAVQKTCRQLGQLGIPVIGAVVTGVN